MGSSVTLKTDVRLIAATNRKLHYVYNFLGIKPEQTFVSPALTPGKYTLGMEFIREAAGPDHESVGRTKLYVNDKVVAEGPMRTQAGKFTLSGEGLCIGFDSGDAVSALYKSPGEFKGGRSSSWASPPRRRSISTSRRWLRQRLLSTEIRQRARRTNRATRRSRWRSQ